MKNLGWALVAGISTMACGGLVKSTTTDAPAASANDPGYVSPADYPAGPYGYAKGSTIADLSFIARRDPLMVAGGTFPAGGANIVTAPVGKVHLAEYRKQFKVLVMSASAQWCHYCQLEQPDLTKSYEDWNTVTAGDHKEAKPTVGFLEVIVQDNAGAPAGINIADQWGRAYGVNFDLGADPTGVLSPYYDINAFPMNMIVKTDDMKIQWQQNGENQIGLQNAVKYTLDSYNQ